MPLPLLGAVAGGLIKKGLGGLAKKFAKKITKKNIGNALQTGLSVARDVVIGGAGVAIGRGFGPGGTTPTLQPHQGGRQVVPAESYAVCNIKGHHMNKSDYFLKSGEFVARGTKCVRNRRMNPLNGHAARKAISRIKGARKMLNRIERSLPKRKSSCGGRCSTRRGK